MRRIGSLLNVLLSTAVLYPYHHRAVVAVWLLSIIPTFWTFIITAPKPVARTRQQQPIEPILCKPLHWKVSPTSTTDRDLAATKDISTSNSNNAIRMPSSSSSTASEVSSDDSSISTVEGMATFLSNRLGWVVLRNIRKQNRTIHETNEALSSVPISTIVNPVIDDENDIEYNTAVAVGSTIDKLSSQSATLSSDSDLTTTIATASTTPTEEYTVLEALDTTSSSVLPNKKIDPPVVVSDSDEKVIQTEIETTIPSNASTIMDDDDDSTNNDITSATTTTDSTVATVSLSPNFVPPVPPVISLGYGKALTVTATDIPGLRYDPIQQQARE